MTTPTMPRTMDAHEIDRIARRRASAKLGWYTHAIVYTLVNALLFAGSSYALGLRPWSVFPLLGWGLGLVLHGIAVFMLGQGSALRERLVQRERDRLLQGSAPRPQVRP